jgi:uncharacterized membrane protein YkvA (DUF1232 family)
MACDSERETQAGQSTERLTPREVMLLVPNIVKLLWRLARDRRVPLRTKLLVVGTAVYLAIPIDIIPDWIPVLGYLDDAVLVGFILHRLLRTVPIEILQQHWDGAIPLPDLATKLRFRRRGNDTRRRV